MTDLARDETPAQIKIGHITISEKPRDRIGAECAECGQGIDVGRSFGVISGDVLLAEWIKRHVHKPKGGSHV